MFGYEFSNFFKVLIFQFQKLQLEFFFRRKTPKSFRCSNFRSQIWLSTDSWKWLIHQWPTKRISEKIKHHIEVNLKHHHRTEIERTNLKSETDMSYVVFATKNTKCGSTSTHKSDLKMHLNGAYWYSLVLFFEKFGLRIVFLYFDTKKLLILQ